MGVIQVTMLPYKVYPLPIPYPIPHTHQLLLFVRTFRPVFRSACRLQKPNKTWGVRAAQLNVGLGENRVG